MSFTRAVNLAARFLRMSPDRVFDILVHADYDSKFEPEAEPVERFGGGAPRNNAELLQEFHDEQAVVREARNMQATVEIWLVENT